MAWGESEPAVQRLRVDIQGATEPEDRLRAGEMAVRSLIALFAKRGQQEDADELREIAASALVDVFANYADRLSPPAPLRPFVVPAIPGSAPETITEAEARQ